MSGSRTLSTKFGVGSRWKAAQRGDWRTFWLGIAFVVACGHPAPAVTEPPANHPRPSPAAASPAIDELPASLVGPAVDPVLAWPVAPFAPGQLAEVKACDVEKLAAARYPQPMTLDDLAKASAAKTTCDQAVLASACAARLKSDAEAPAACLNGLRAVLRANPAFAFVQNLAGAYLGRVVLVAPPPASARALTSVRIVYRWGGLGTPVNWTVAAKELVTTPKLDVTGRPNAVWSPDVAAAVSGLGHALTDLLPIRNRISAIACTDNNPAWTVTLAFDDGSKLDLTTEGSNLIGLGGPWQTTIDGVVYLQLAPEFGRAMEKLVKVLALPIGQPAGMFCFGFDLQAAVLGR